MNQTDGTNKLKDYVQSYGEILLRDFEAKKAKFAHNGDKGDAAEEILREFLRDYLPPFNRLGQGEIIDTKGTISGQTDIVITNEYHPFFKETSPSLFIIEGIACVGEVKSILNSNELDKTLNACKKFKTLVPDIGTGSITGTNEEDRKRFIERRPYFLFAYKAKMKLSGIREKIQSFNSENNLSIPLQIDSVFCLDKGIVLNLGSGEGALRCISPRGENLRGYIVKEISTSNTLTYFIGWLSAVIQRMVIFRHPLTRYFLSTDPPPLPHDYSSVTETVTEKSSYIASSFDTRNLQEDRNTKKR